MLARKLLEKLQNNGAENLCRLCLNEGSLRDIMGTKLPHMIESCFEIKITRDRICILCLRQIIRLYTYKQRIMRVQNILQELIQSKQTNLFSEEPCCNIKIRTGISESDKDKLEELENVHEEIQKKKIELNECTKKLISYNLGPPPLVPISNLINTKVLEDSLGSKTDSLPPLVPINTDCLENKSLSCSKFSENFENTTILLKHKESSSNFSCNICNQIFCGRDALISHLRAHKKIKNYLCTICGKKYSSPSTFKVHMRIHTGEKPFKCKICNKSFIRSAGLNSHMIVHNRMKPHKCDICGKGFKVLSNMYRHKRLHTGVTSFYCNYCAKSFNQSEHLKLHIRIHHTNEKPFLCSECGKSFVNSQRLKRHSWRHTGLKPYSCSLCPKTYTNLTDLKNHRLKVHSERISKFLACSVCPKKFADPTRLTIHMRDHTETEDIKPMHELN